MRRWDDRELKMNEKKIKRNEKLLKKIETYLKDDEVLLQRVEEGMQRVQKQLEEYEALKVSITARIEKEKQWSIETRAEINALRQTEKGKR